MDAIITMCMARIHVRVATNYRASKSGSRQELHYSYTQSRFAISTQTPFICVVVSACVNVYVQSYLAIPSLQTHTITNYLIGEATVNIGYCVYLWTIALYLMRAYFLTSG